MARKTYRYICLWGWLLVLLQGCSGGAYLLPSAIGSPYEVLVVADEAILKGEAGQSIRDVLNFPIPRLPQNEPYFSISQTPSDKFNDLLKPVRNIVMVEVDQEIKSPQLSYSKDVWANGQVVLRIKAPDKIQLKESIDQNKWRIIHFLNKAERERQIAWLKKNTDQVANDRLYEQMNVLLTLPDDLGKIKQGDNFFWTSNGAYKRRTDYVVYAVPYNSVSQLDPEHLIVLRDSVMKANIPGGPEGSYMTTHKKVLPPIARIVNLNNAYCVEMRGLWEMEGDIMGGPYISLSQVDELNQRLITAEAFVYAPEMEKADLVRKMEAVLYTLKVPQKMNLEEITVEIDSIQQIN